MTKDEYIARAAAVYMAESGLDETGAKAAAEACYDALDADTADEAPEDMAREDMSYWTNDGD